MVTGRHHCILRCGLWGQAAVAAVVSLRAASPAFSCPHEEGRSVHHSQVRDPRFTAAASSRVSPRDALLLFHGHWGATCGSHQGHAECTCLSFFHV